MKISPYNDGGWTDRIWAHLIGATDDLGRKIFRRDTDGWSWYFLKSSPNSVIATEKGWLTRYLNDAVIKTFLIIVGIIWLIVRIVLDGATYLSIVTLLFGLFLLVWMIRVWIWIYSNLIKKQLA